MLLSLAVEAFILHKQAEGLAPGTLTTYRWVLATLIEHLGDVEFRTLTKTDAVSFMAFARARQTHKGTPPTDKTIENVWICCKSFDTWRVAECEYAPWFVVARPKGDYSQPQPFEADDLKRLMHAAAFTKSADTHTRKQFSMRRHTAKRDTALVLLLLDTGMRAGEVGRLNIGDVDFGTGTVDVARWGSGKKTKGRVVYVGTRCRKALFKLAHGREGNAPLFVTASGKRLDASGILHLIHAMGLRAGVRKCHPHRFRHTFAIQYLRNGGDVFTLQKLLGHSDLAMSRRYALIANTDTRDVHAKASPVDRWGL